MTYQVQISSPQWTPTGLVFHWVLATSHVYKRKAAAARLASELASPQSKTRVVAVAS